MTIRPPVGPTWSAGSTRPRAPSAPTAPPTFLSSASPSWHARSSKDVLVQILSVRMRSVREVTHEFSVFHFARAGDAGTQRARAERHRPGSQRGDVGLRRGRVVRGGEPIAVAAKSQRAV